MVDTWWCWHIYKGDRVPRVERGVGSSLPPAELARRDSALFEKNEVHFFYCADGKFGEVAGVFSH